VTEVILMGMPEKRWNKSLVIPIADQGSLIFGRMKMIATSQYLQTHCLSGVRIEG
jgi:hypothetical protein